MRERGGRLIAAVVLGWAVAAYAAEPGEAGSVVVESGDPGPVDAGPSAPPKSPSWRGAVLLDQWRPIDRSRALDVPSPITRDEAVQRVTLKEAIAMALENNPSIAARRLEPARVDTTVLETQSSFDPTLGGEIDYRKSITPNASFLTGTTRNVVEQRTADVHLSKLFRSSTRVTTDFLNERLDNNATYFSLRPQYSPELRLSVVQPLLRDFGWDFSYLVVRVSERNADAAVYLYEADVVDFVGRVIIAYWRVVSLREAVDVQREALALANRTTEENEARVRVGLFAPVAVLEAQADAKRREEELIRGENDLDVARQELAQLAFYRPNDTFVPRTLEPLEEATPEEVTFDLDESLAVALVDRPEIVASALGVESRQIQERIASNGLLPRLDVVGSYGVNGLAGNTQPRSSTSFISPTNLQGDPAHPDVTCTPITNDIFQCTVPLDTRRQVATFSGPQRDAYSTRGGERGGLLSGDWESYSFGVRLTVPLDNALARSQHTRSAIERDQAELNHRELLSRVTLEVRRTIADMIAGRQRINASHVASQLAEENLRNQEKRHEVGMATTKDLLDFQQRLTAARFAEVSAKLDYTLAVARWRRAKGQLLTHYQVIIEHPGRRSTPWFARF
jgi:outer membrane protein TolC